MILVDSRSGSKELLPLIPGGVLTTLDAADFAVLTPHVAAGVERKTVGDLLRVIADGRFTSEQLPKMFDNYQRLYLLIEGSWRVSPEGELLQRKGANYEPITWGRRGGWKYAEVARWMFSLEESAGVRIHRTPGPRETGQWLLNLDAELSKDPAERKLLHAIYTPPIQSLRPPTLVRRFGNILPGISQERSLAFAAEFKTIAEAVNAEEKRWWGIDGIGKKTARAALAAIWGRKA